MKVKILGRKNSTSLVEWIEDEVPHRSFVPIEAITEVGGEVYCDYPEQGVPYGISWSMFVGDDLPENLAIDFEVQLHKRGVWTMNDLSNNPQKVTNSLQKVFGSVISNMRSRVLKGED